ncbi:MAG: threonylcarbamoyl-AMP synthase [Muribaculaceae bacterium]|nr:threonylcarbamoyl-AMP synthase [Muribaculaceae bacterium]
MKTIKIWNDSPSERQLDEIADSLRDGDVVIIPTDTLYGVACDALNPKAIEKICHLKGLNPEKAPLSVICSDISMAAEYAKIDDASYHLLRANTPGPFTFIFRALSGLPKAFKNRKEVGIRIPDCATSRLIAERLGNPVMTTSIEYEDEDHAREPGLIAEAYADNVDLLVEGEEGMTEASTVVYCIGNDCEIRRQGRGELQ